MPPYPTPIGSPDLWNRRKNKLNLASYLFILNVFKSKMRLRSALLLSASLIYFETVLCVVTVIIADRLSLLPSSGHNESTSVLT